jgi:hypothetical protein
VAAVALLLPVLLGCATMAALLPERLFGEAPRSS